MRKTIVCLDQADALKYMAHKKIPGFIDKAVETLERKNQGDLSLANEVAQAHFDPTDAQKLLQAGSSAVAQVPADHGFVRFNGGMGAAAGPVATNDSTAMFLQYIRDKDEKDREARALELAVREKASAEEREHQEKMRERQDKARALELAEEREKDRQAGALELAVREKASADEREKDREVHAFELAVRVCVC